MENALPSGKFPKVPFKAFLFSPYSLGNLCFLGSPFSVLTPPGNVLLSDF